MAFCCLILGWLIATEGSFIEAVVTLGGTYGTILAGIPVLVAVVVAKQQLDSNRKQHKLNIELSFYGLSSSLIEMKQYFTSLNGYANHHVNSGFIHPLIFSMFPIIPTRKMMDSWGLHIPTPLLFLAESVKDDLTSAQEDFERTGYIKADRDQFSRVLTGSRIMLTQIENKLEEIKKFTS